MKWFLHIDYNLQPEKLNLSLLQERTIILPNIFGKGTCEFLKTYPFEIETAGSLQMPCGQPITNSEHVLWLRATASISFLGPASKHKGGPSNCHQTPLSYPFLSCGLNLWVPNSFRALSHQKCLGIIKVHSFMSPKSYKITIKTGRSRDATIYMDSHNDSLEILCVLGLFSPPSYRSPCHLPSLMGRQ